MAKRMAAALLVVVLLATSCGEDEDQLEQFQSMIDVGFSCNSLFDVRNEMSGDDPSLAEPLNDALRLIGCFSSTSERTD